MALTRAAQRALRVSARRRILNLRRIRAMRRIVKQVRRAVAAGALEEARALIPVAYQAIDKAAKRGVIKKNAAARKKSRLMKLLQRVAS